MNDDFIGWAVFVAVLILPAALIAFWWRQRLRFTRGADPVLSASVRWWLGPIGLGWRQGYVRLTKEELFWRRRLSWRSRPNLVVPRSALTLVSRTRTDWQAWLWLDGSDVLTFTSAERRLHFGLVPNDADLLLDWLGTWADRPPPRVNRRVSVGLWVAGLAAVSLLYWGVTGRPGLLPAIAVITVVFGLGGGVVLAFVRSRRLVSQALADEVVSTAREDFAFLEDFGFDDAYVQHFPWRTTVISPGSYDRFITLTIDRRVESLDVVIGHRSSEAEPRRLRDILAEAGHPDPDRVTRYSGSDGPLRAALEANSHALRLWGRAFLTEQTAREELKG